MILIGSIIQIGFFYRLALASGTRFSRFADQSFTVCFDNRHSFWWRYLFWEDKQAPRGCVVVYNEDFAVESTHHTGTTLYESFT
jgi:hypothetical protein